MDSQPQEGGFNMEHAEHVKENDYLTWKRAQGNKLYPKRGFLFKRMCGTL